MWFSCSVFLENYSSACNLHYFCYFQREREKYSVLIKKKHKIKRNYSRNYSRTV